MRSIEHIKLSPLQGTTMMFKKQRIGVPCSRFSRFQWIVAILLATDATLRFAQASSTASKDSNSKFPKPGIKADSFVQASPLVCAAVCGDGVLVVAAHVNVDDSEPLLYYSSNDAADSATDNSNDANGSFIDLPPNFQGPFRIHSGDTRGTCLASAGWRADGDALLRKCRRVADEERATYGDETSPLYVRFLATELSLYLAQCEVSERTRTLACASLLASPTEVWLVDSTGAHCVRALCIGGGGTSDGKLVSDAVNQQLVEHDWETMTTNAALKTLLQILSGTSEHEHIDDSNPAPRLVPVNTRLEVASVESSSKPFARRKLSSFAFIKDTR
ncbi:hypothetical protein MPSEU_000288300 [Mayamaea pseudoterrestris]|nr:hypothetical protein MPSEU_000288300 [Mayamaea pseudoterrestris]